MYCLGPFSGEVWYVQKNLEKNLENYSAWAHPLGCCGIIMWCVSWELGLECFNVGFLSRFADVLWRVWARMCVHRACVYVYTRTCMSHIIVRIFVYVHTRVYVYTHVFAFTHAHVCLILFYYRCANKGMHIHIQVVSEAQSLQWKSRGDQVLRTRAMLRRACQIRHSLDSFGTKVACSREVPVHARNNPKMGVDVNDYGGATGAEAVDDNETAVRTPLVLGGTRRDLGWLASVPWQLEPSSSWQVFLLFSHCLVIVSSRHCCWMMMRLWLFPPLFIVIGLGPLRLWQIVDRGPPIPIYQLVEVSMC